MNKKPVLVVLAAGMGSRYGGLKQIDPVGSQGEAILDYSLFDAHEAGFETAVIIIKEAIREDFMATVGTRLERCPMEIRYAYQELDHLPAGYAVPTGRTKPWGTSHAVLCAAEAIGDAPFVVINADDYYGKSAFRVIYDALCHIDSADYNYCMVGYHLGNTVTEHGSVSRGVCATDENSFLTSITERTRIEQHPEAIYYTEDGVVLHELPADTIVSMNIWGFTSHFLDALRTHFPAFLDKALAENPQKAEYYLPLAVEELLSQGNTKVKVLSSPDKWYGVTYAADKPAVVAALREMANQGLYPDGLWS